jgi:oligopeptide transport system substrate-binding protein
MSRKFVLVATLLLVLSMVLSSCKPAEKLAASINLNFATEPPTMDPGLATDTTSVDCVNMLFMGLTKLDIETVEPKAWLATEWSVSADGLVWTFKMRKDVSWIRWDPATQKAEKKRNVVAGDIVYGVRRVANPETASDYAYVDYIIKNVQAVNTGESTDLESIGVRAVDDYTVEFTLTQPAGYFPAIAGMWTNNPVPREPIEEFGDKWTEPGNVWTCGPAVLDVWEHENKVVMKKSTNWFDAKNVKIDTYNWAIVNDDATAMAMYENGELDVTPPPLADMDRVKADATLSKELYIGPGTCTYYYGFNTSKPPLDNVKVRQALSYGINRQKLVDTVLKGGQKPADAFACPGVFGTPTGDAKWKGINFDAAKGKALLAEAGYPDGKGLPEITLMFNTSAGHQRIAEFIQQSWKENLGIEVKLANQEWAVYLKTVNTDAPQIYRMGWCLDYPDENNWVLENFHTTKSLNNPKWSGPNAAEFDRLTEEAALSSDPAKRKELYFKAEELLTVTDAVIAPIYFYTSVVMTKPYVDRTYSKAGHQEFWYWKVKAH